MVLDGNTVSGLQGGDVRSIVHTMAGAYADFAENVKGSLEPGEFADIIVWRDNPYIAAPENIVSLTIDLTLVGGKVVYQQGVK